MTPGHEQLHDDLAAYAVGALPPAEAAELERHLADCPRCRERLQWLQPAVEVLRSSVEQRTPPPDLRERLLATVRAEAADEGLAPASARDSRWRALRGFALRPATGFAAAALLVAGVLGGYALRGNPDDETTLVEAVPVAPAQAETTAATLERQDGFATLHVHELPEIDRDQVYEVWVQRAGVMEPASTFVPRHDGTAEAAIPGSLEDADAVLVTREPRGGSDRPTTRPLLEAALD